MLENESFYWLLGALLGGLMASFMAVRTQRWLNRPLVMLLAILVSAWVSAMAARSSVSPAPIASARAAAAAWCYPWICLTLLDVYRRTWISTRIFPLGALMSRSAVIIGPLSLVAIAITSYMSKLEPSGWAISIALMTSFGVSFGYLITQMGMVSRPHAITDDRQRLFRRAISYPTIDGFPIKKGTIWSRKKSPVAGPVAEPGPPEDAHSAMVDKIIAASPSTDIGEGETFRLPPPPHAEMEVDLDLQKILDGLKAD